MNDKFDDVLFNLLKEVKTIPDFFDVVFGFLFRRTDFYHISSDPNIGVGLPTGLAESLVKNAFFKYALANKVIETPETDETEVVVETTDVVACTGKKSKDNKPVTMEDYNGATCENYSWSQSISDVDVQIKVPDNLTWKQLSVDVSTRTICVKLKQSDRVLVAGELCDSCRPQEVVWSIDGCTLQLHMEKAREKWWDCLVTTEERLDISRLDCSRPFHELSEEAQAKIEEFTWNQERKKCGLPTADQLKLEDTLREAWNAKGSPFTGEFDPTKVKLG